MVREPSPLSTVSSVCPFTVMVGSLYSPGVGWYTILVFWC